MTRDEAIAAITDRLVDHYSPERIYLFGSVARGDAGPDNDLDFCVVVPDNAPAELLHDGRIYSLLRGMDQLRHEETRDWLDPARRDMTAARPLAAGEAHAEALFHCQQAAE